MALSAESPQRFRFGEFELDPESAELRRNGTRSSLQGQPLQILALLLERPGRLVTREEIKKKLWPAGTFVDFDRSLNRAVNRLREALGDSAEQPRFIETLPRRGYRFVAEVTSDGFGSDSTAVRVLPPTSGGSDDSPTFRSVQALALQTRQESQPTRRWRTRALWATLILAAAGATWLVARHGHGSALLPPMTIHPIVTLPGMEGALSFSPDGTRMTFAWRRPNQADSRIVVRMVDDEAVQEVTRGSHDSWPAWSPDGRSIAFVRNPTLDRNAAAHSGIYVIPAIGGPERQVYSGQVCPRGGATWAPDGRSLVFAAIRTPTENCNLYRLSLDTLEATRLMSPETVQLGRADPAAGEFAPAFSPDGKTISFMHYVGDYDQDLYLMPSQGGTPKRLTLDDKEIWEPVAWTPDSTAILFESSRGGSPELWRVPASGGQPERLSVAGNASGGVALDKEGRRLAYIVRSMRCHISAFGLLNPGEPPVRIAESTRSEFSPSFSSDGNRIAFASDRAGDALDIWIADADGTNQMRLTSSSHGESGSPRWSPDNDWLAYDSDASVDRQFDIYVIRVSGGAPQRLTFDRSNEYGPSWSRDGRWLYFASDRTGKDQIYKMPRAGGVAVQITKGGGFPGAESADGRFLYYSKGKGKSEAGVWRVPIDGGLEEPVITASPAGPYWRFWALVEDGIYYLDTQNETRPSVDFFRFATNRAKRILELPRPPALAWTASLAVSPDRRSLLTGFNDPRGSEIFMVENFR